MTVQRCVMVASACAHGMSSFAIRFNLKNNTFLLRRTSKRYATLRLDTTSTRNLRVDGKTELWNHVNAKHMEMVGLIRSEIMYSCTAVIPPHAEIAIKYNQSSPHYGAYTIGCDGVCASVRKQMRWRIYTELQRMNPSFQMTEYTEKELYNEFLRHHNAQTTSALMVVYARTQGSPFSSMPRDLFRWFVKKYLLKPMEAFCYTGPRMITHTLYLLTMARLTNVMLIADGSAPLRYQK